MNPIKLYEENKVIAGFSLLNLLFKQGRCRLVKLVMDKLLCLYEKKKIKPVVDSLWALEEVRVWDEQRVEAVTLSKGLVDIFERFITYVSQFFNAVFCGTLTAGFGDSFTGGGWAASACAKIITHQKKPNGSVTSAISQTMII